MRSALHVFFVGERTESRIARGALEQAIFSERRGGGILFCNGDGSPARHAVQLREGDECDDRFGRIGFAQRHHVQFRRLRKHLQLHHARRRGAEARQHPHPHGYGLCEPLVPFPRGTLSRKIALQGRPFLSEGRRKHIGMGDRRRPAAGRKSSRNLDVQQCRRAKPRLDFGRGRGNGITGFFCRGAVKTIYDAK